VGSNFQEQLAVLPGNLANHMLITVVPLLAGIVVSLPLAVVATRRPRLRYPVLAAVSIVQTIPSLALLALMVPVLVGLGALTSQWMGVEVSALGFTPTVLALTLYSMLPIVRNTVTGITGVEPALTEAARGVGMTPRQVLWRVELPLAAPVIVAGIRTATVWVTGIATLATPVGQRCLGNYIFRGLQTRNWVAVLFGCVAAALLAIVLDTLIGGLERAVREGRRTLGVVSGAALALLVAGGLVAPSLTRRSDAAHAVVVGSKTFTEQYILARLIVDTLEADDLPAREKGSLGSTIVFDALKGGEVDVYVDYSGTLWANAMGREGSGGAQEVLDELTDWLQREYGITCLGSLGFENAYGLAVTRETAERLQLETIADLVPHAGGMEIGGDYEFFGRPEWRAVRDGYGLAFADQKSYDSTFMYDALLQGEVDVIAAFTSDGRIVAHDLVVLEDPRDALPPYDAILLLSPEASKRAALVDALEPLVGAIDVETMREANYQVDREESKRTVDQAAEWLRERLE
jgi:osmoprotectant transport system permease protein